MRQSALNLAEAIRDVIDPHGLIPATTDGFHPDFLKAAWNAENASLECSSFGFAESFYIRKDPVAYEAAVRLAKAFLAIKRFKDHWEPASWRDDLEPLLADLEASLGIHQPVRPQAPPIDRMRPPVELRVGENGESVAIIFGAEYRLSASEARAIAVLVKVYPKSIMLDEFKKQGCPGAGGRIADLIKKPETPWSLIIVRPGRGTRNGYRLTWPVNDSATS
jgi:hypothetical protein